MPRAGLGAPGHRRLAPREVDVSQRSCLQGRNSQRSADAGPGLRRSRTPALGRGGAPNCDRRPQACSDVKTRDQRSSERNDEGVDARRHDNGHTTRWRGEPSNACARWEQEGRPALRRQETGNVCVCEPSGNPERRNRNLRQHVTGRYPPDSPEATAKRAARAESARFWRRRKGDESPGCAPPACSGSCRVTRVHRPSVDCQVLGDYPQSCPPMSRDGVRRELALVGRLGRR